MIFKRGNRKQYDTHIEDAKKYFIKYKHKYN